MLRVASCLCLPKNVLSQNNASGMHLVYRDWSHGGCSAGVAQREPALTSTARSECVEQSAAAGGDPALSSASSTGGRPTGSSWSACQAHKTCLCHWAQLNKGSAERAVSLLSTRVSMLLESLRCFLTISLLPLRTRTSSTLVSESTFTCCGINCARSNAVVTRSISVLAARRHLRASPPRRWLRRCHLWQEPPLRD